MVTQDEWPQMADGSCFDGKNLWNLLRNGESPFQKTWDVCALVKEVEDALYSRVVDIPFVYNGSNCYGFHFKLEKHPDVIARISRGDVNMSEYDGFPEEEVKTEIRFEAAVCQLLQTEPAIRCSRLLYHRIPLSIDGPKTDVPDNHLGRHLMVFDRAEGENNVWRDIDRRQQVHLLEQAAGIRAELFNFTLPLDFATTWLRERLFEQRPSEIPVPVANTREFTLSLLESKINATIRNLGDRIGWESDEEVVGPIALSAKKSLLHVAPLILPPESERDEPCLYRLVLDHGDFGIHNMQISLNRCSCMPEIKSLYDWETGCIIPAVLSDPLMAVSVDLVPDEKARASVTRVKPEPIDEDLELFQNWSQSYFQELYKRAPDYRKAIVAGRDARYLWFKLKDWRGQDPEGYFGALGIWAEERLADLERN